MSKSLLFLILYFIISNSYIIKINDKKFINHFKYKLITASAFVSRQSKSSKTIYPSVIELYHKAQDLLRRGDSFAAEKLLYRCIEINPEDSRSWLALARLEASLGRLDEARRLFALSHGYFPNNVYLLHAWGIVEYKSGHSNLAREYWSKAIDINKYNPYVCLSLSNLEKKSGNYAEAKALIDRVIKFRPTAPLFISLSEIHRVQGNFEAAKACLTQGLKFCVEDSIQIILSLASLEEEVFMNIDESMKLIQRALELDSSNIHVYIAKASIEIRNNNIQTARESLTKASELPASDGKHFTMWSTLEMDLGNVETAIEILKRGSERFPGDPFLLQRWGTIEAKLSRISKARELFLRSIQIRPHAPTFVAWAILEEKEIEKRVISDDEESKYLISDSQQPIETDILSNIKSFDLTAFEENTDMSYSLKDLQNFLKDFPISTNFSSKMFAKRQLSLSRFLFNMGLRTDPQHGPVYHAYGNLEMRLGNYSGARNIFKQGLERNCTDISSIYHAIGLLEMKCNNIHDARAALEKGIDILLSVNSHDATLSFLFHTLGTLEIHDGRLNEAFSIFSKALRIYPKHSQLLLGMALTYFKLFKYDEAREYFKKSVDSDPTHAHAWQVWAIAEKSLTNIDTARELFNKGTHNCPYHGPLWQAHGLMEFEAGDVNSARKLFEESIRNCPMHAQSYQAWACLELNQGNFIRSKQLASTGIKRCPNHPALWTIASLAEEKLGNVTRARQIISFALKLFPKHGALYKVFGEIEAKYGTIANARKIFRIGIQMDPTYAPLYQTSALLEARLGDLEALSILHKKAKENLKVNIVNYDLFQNEEDIFDKSMSLL